MRRIVRVDICCVESSPASLLTSSLTRSLAISLVGSITIAATLFSTGCALLGTDDDPVKKNSRLEYRPPEDPFQKATAGSADATWQSSITGNSIAFNSSCQRLKDSVDLETLQQNIVNGVEHAKILSEKTVTLDGHEARRVVVEGRSDGVGVKVDLVMFRKSDCTYDLTYVARTKTFEKEHSIFDNFLQGFHVP